MRHHHFTIMVCWRRNTMPLISARVSLILWWTKNLRHWLPQAMQKAITIYITYMNGLLQLREKVLQKKSAAFTRTISVPDASHYGFTPGGTYTIYTALTTILQPGDEVIVFEPAYDGYIPTDSKSTALCRCSSQWFFRLIQSTGNWLNKNICQNKGHYH